MKPFLLILEACLDLDTATVFRCIKNAPRDSPKYMSAFSPGASNTALVAAWLFFITLFDEVCPERHQPTSHLFHNSRGNWLFNNSMRTQAGCAPMLRPAACIGTGRVPCASRSDSITSTVPLGSMQTQWSKNNDQRNRAQLLGAKGARTQQRSQQQHKHSHARTLRSNTPLLTLQLPHQ